jgi:bacteriocin leader peptide (microcyclamide/patellamide family)
MNNKSISPNLQQPVDRVPTGQLPSALAELSEAQLDGGIGTSDLDSGLCLGPCMCSYDGDDE